MSAPVIRRYLLRQVSAVFFPALAGLIALYLLIDFSERLDILVRNNASVSSSLRYFLFKIPLMVSQILPVAALVSVLAAVGILGRSRELVAMQAGGMMPSAIFRPLLAAAAMLSLTAFAWSEWIVPPFSHRSQQVNRGEIRRDAAALLPAREGVWLRGADGFYSVDTVDAASQTIRGVRVFRPGAERRFEEIAFVREARWQDGAWQTSEGWRANVEASGEVVRKPTHAGEIRFQEPLEAFLETKVRAEELDARSLHARIEALRSRGFPHRDEEVDLAMKFAVPLAPFFLVVLALSYVASRSHTVDMARCGLLGLLIGFCYWGLLGFSKSLAEAGALPVTLGAWSPNLFCLLAATALWSRADD